MPASLSNVRKNIGSKRVDLDDACIDLILKAYEGFDQNEVHTADNLVGGVQGV